MSVNIEAKNINNDDEATLTRGQIEAMLSNAHEAGYWKGIAKSFMIFGLFAIIFGLFAMICLIIILI